MCPGASRIKPEKTMQMRFGRGAQEQRKGNETDNRGSHQPLIHKETFFYASCLHSMDCEGMIQACFSCFISLIVIYYNCN